MTPDDWPFQTLKLGEYFSLARQAARIVRERRIEFSDAVEEVLSPRSVTDRERARHRTKERSTVRLPRSFDVICYVIWNIESQYVAIIASRVIIVLVHVGTHSQVLTGDHTKSQSS